MDMIPFANASEQKLKQKQMSRVEPKSRTTSGGKNLNQSSNTLMGRHQSIMIRNSEEVVAMSGVDRLRARFKSMAGGTDAEANQGDIPYVSANNNSQKSFFQMDESRRRKQQYRVETHAGRIHMPLWKRCLTCRGILRPIRSDIVTQNQRLAMYLHWMFRVNFLFLFVVMCGFFFILVMIFAFFIYVAGKMDSECVRIGGNEFNEADSPFSDAFALSWTTFSTVGYGSTYPALGHQNDSPSNCFFISSLCSLESLVGVLYSGFCGAILFGKVLRIQSRGRVEFSDPIVIRYGTGVTGTKGGEGPAEAAAAEGEGTDDEDDEDDEEMASSGGEGGDSSGGGGTPPAPFPVLEFRIVNLEFNEVGGEIMDANLNVVANTDSRDADRNEASARRTFFHRTRSSMYEAMANESDTESDSSMHGTDLSYNLRSKQILDSLISTFGRRQQATVVEDDPQGGPAVISKQLFTKMMIESPEHPFFKRVWVARHELDDQSPLLIPSVRRKIARSGSWPAELNTWDKIRHAISFNQILVSLNGVSNVSASDVYAQKMYDFVDVNIGYQFVNILYRDPVTGHIGVDVDLINDVREQDGGGGEPLTAPDDYMGDDAEDK